MSSPLPSPSLRSGVSGCSAALHRVPTGSGPVLSRCCHGEARRGEDPRRLTMSLPAKRCGRPPMLSFLEKKKRKQSLDRRRGKTRIYVGNHIDRWLTLKEKLDFRNDAEVAGFLLDMYDSYNPLSKATLCPLSEGVRRITVKEARALSASTSLITADGTYDSGDQLLKESACSGFGDVRIVTVKEEEEMLPDCMLTRTADTETQRP
ncbi:uncharacterized protein LOC116453658 [Corvus moneduloides]|uniref:uncharacterized protein LOC116453658 n=1 Tax=Corvus moneduloides TaxID=1196302 RepID=UPI001362D6AA|nr:uncharacterized protein LOC116453658 [Corvus moneduloides]